MKKQTNNQNSKPSDPATVNSRLQSITDKDQEDEKHVSENQDNNKKNIPFQFKAYFPDGPGGSYGGL